MIGVGGGNLIMLTVIHLTCVIMIKFEKVWIIMLVRSC